MLLNLTMTAVKKCIDMIKYGVKVNSEFSKSCDSELSVDEISKL